MARRGNGAGHGGPATGKGWGGPARPGNGSPGMLIPGGATKAARETAAEKEARRAEQADRMRDILADIAENGEHDQVRIMAISAFLDRVEGRPVARNLNVDTSMTVVVKRFSLDPPTIEHVPPDQGGS